MVKYLPQDHWYDPCELIRTDILYDLFGKSVFRSDFQVHVFCPHWRFLFVMYLVQCAHSGLKSKDFISLVYLINTFKSFEICFLMQELTFKITAKHYVYDKVAQWVFLKLNKYFLQKWNNLNLIRRPVHLLTGFRV